jgi:hypothetical protein
VAGVLVDDHPPKSETHVSYTINTPVTGECAPELAGLHVLQPPHLQEFVVTAVTRVRYRSAHEPAAKQDSRNNPKTRNNHPCMPFSTFCSTKNRYTLV